MSRTVSCSFIMVNSDTVVYFELIPRTMLSCCKHSVEHQMCINPQLKIVPQKTHFLHLSGWHFYHSTQLFPEITMPCVCGRWY